MKKPPPPLYVPIEASEHRGRHLELHDALQELAADYMAETGGDLGLSVREFLMWSGYQTVIPSTESENALGIHPKKVV